jgi:excisionase family DNA binding protein
MRGMNVNTKYDQVEEQGDGLLTKRELARRLRLSTRSIDAWMRTKHLPYLKCGKTVRFRWADVVEKLNAFRVN